MKSYDEAYAREAFQSMDNGALQHLWSSLKPEDIYDPAGDGRSGRCSSCGVTAEAPVSC